MACSTTQVDGDLLIVGLIIEPAEQVAFRPLDGTDVDLDIYALVEAPNHHAYAAFVGQPERRTQLLAFDACGIGLGRHSFRTGGFQATQSEPGRAFRHRHRSRVGSRHIRLGTGVKHLLAVIRQRSGGTRQTPPLPPPLAGNGLAMCRRSGLGSGPPTARPISMGWTSLPISPGKRTRRSLRARVTGDGAAARSPHGRTAAPPAALRADMTSRRNHRSGSQGLLKGDCLRRHRVIYSTHHAIRIARC
jgi:hypothetical protein